MQQFYPDVMDGNYIWESDGMKEAARYMVKIVIDISIATYITKKNQSKQTIKKQLLLKITPLFQSSLQTTK